MACHPFSAILQRDCISTKAGTFTNLPHCGKVVSTKVGCGVSPANVAVRCQPSF
jgi:hypothetical protein